MSPPPSCRWWPGSEVPWPLGSNLWLTLSPSQGVTCSLVASFDIDNFFFFFWPVQGQPRHAGSGVQAGQANCPGTQRYGCLGPHVRTGFKNQYIYIICQRQLAQKCQQEKCLRTAPPPAQELMTNYLFSKRFPYYRSTHTAVNGKRTVAATRNWLTFLQEICFFCVKDVSSKKCKQMPIFFRITFQVKI